MAFEAHCPAVARFLTWAGHEPADVEDLVAGTFEVAWRKIDQLPQGPEALPWLLAVARNLSNNAQRKARRETAFLRAWAPLVPVQAELGAGERALAVEVIRALGELKPVDRDLILLVAWDQLNVRCAGEVLGLTPVAARSRLHRARRRLRETERSGP